MATGQMGKKHVGLAIGLSAAIPQVSSAIVSSQGLIEQNAALLCSRVALQTPYEKSKQKRNDTAKKNYG